jgi:hypothetical protein
LAFSGLASANEMKSCPSQATRSAERAATKPKPTSDEAELANERPGTRLVKELGMRRPSAPCVAFASVAENWAAMCNVYSLTKAAIRQLFRVTRDLTGNLPPLPGIFPDGMAPVVRTGTDGERELAMLMLGAGEPTSH